MNSKEKKIVQKLFFNLNRMKLDIDSKPKVKRMLQMKILKKKYYQQDQGNFSTNNS